MHVARHIDATKKLIPNKPIRYVMNTHPHADHTGGLPALAAEGAIIITQKNNVEFLEKSLNTPRTLLTPVDPLRPLRGRSRSKLLREKVYSMESAWSRCITSRRFSFERLDYRVHSQGEGSLPGDSHSQSGRASQRSHQGPGSVLEKPTWTLIATSCTSRLIRSPRNSGRRSVWD